VCVCERESERESKRESGRERKRMPRRSSHAHCSQLLVLLAKEPYTKDDILQKRPIILRSLQMIPEVDAFVLNKRTCPLFRGYHRGRRSYFIDFDCQNFQQVCTVVPVHIKHIFTGVPKFSYNFSIVETESPSLKRPNDQIVRSRDPNISSLISSVGGSLKLILLLSS